MDTKYVQNWAWNSVKNWTFEVSNSHHHHHRIDCMNEVKIRRRKKIHKWSNRFGGFTSSCSCFKHWARAVNIIYDISCSALLFPHNFFRLEFNFYSNFFCVVSSSTHLRIFFRKLLWWWLSGNHTKHMTTFTGWVKGHSTRSEQIYFNVFLARASQLWSTNKTLRELRVNSTESITKHLLSIVFLYSFPFTLFRLMLDTFFIRGDLRLTKKYDFLR